MPREYCKERAKLALASPVPFEWWAKPLPQHVLRPSAEFQAKPLMWAGVDESPQTASRRLAIRLIASASG
jgi:hypothetical protein